MNQFRLKISPPISFKINIILLPLTGFLFTSGCTSRNVNITEGKFPEEIVYAMAEDGVPNAGMIFNATPDSTGSTAVIWVHGWGINFYYPTYVNISRSLAERGYTCINVNTRMHDIGFNIGETKTMRVRGGGYWGKPSEEVLDLAAWIGFAEKRGFKQVVLAGHSAGWEAVCRYQAEKQDPRIAGIVLASGSVTANTDPSDPELLKDATRLVTEGHGDDLLRIPNRRFPSFISAATFLDMAETPIEYKDFFGIKISNPGITKIQCPILAFYGTNGDVGNEDDLELLESCIRKHSAKPGQLKTRMIRNADHMYSGEEDQVANILTEWIDGLPEMAGVRESIRSNDTMPKVTGIGGIFFISKDPKAAREWYGKNLGLSIDDYGSVFEFRNGNRPDEINYLRWSPFEEGSDYLKPSEKDFMINYRVQNMEALVKQLRDDGVTIVDGIEEYEYGKFVHILDPEGNKIELWEPVDSVLTRLGGPSTK